MDLALRIAALLALVTVVPLLAGWIVGSLFAASDREASDLDDYPSGDVVDLTRRHPRKEGA